MSAAALVESTASFLTSKATTAKPRPALPARAASISAFRASRLVCWAMEVMTLMSGVNARNLAGQSLNTLEVALELVGLLPPTASRSRR